MTPRTPVQEAAHHYLLLQGIPNPTPEQVRETIPIVNRARLARTEEERQKRAEYEATLERTREEAREAKRKRCTHPYGLAGGFSSCSACGVKKRKE